MCISISLVLVSCFNNCGIYGRYLAGKIYLMPQWVALAVVNFIVSFFFVIYSLLFFCSIVRAGFILGSYLEVWFYVPLLVSELFCYMEADYIEDLTRVLNFY